MKLKYFINYKYTNKFIKNRDILFVHNSFLNKVNLINFNKFLLLILNIYLYLYVGSNIGQRILLINDGMIPYRNALYISYLTNSFLIEKFSTIRELISFNITKNKILILKWLEYFIQLKFYKNKKNKHNFDLILYNKLSNLYYKLKKNYKKTYDNILCDPEILLILKDINVNRTIEKSITNPNTVIIELSKELLSFFINSFYEKVVLSNNHNQITIYKYILSIFVTSIIHGNLF